MLRRRVNLCSAFSICACSRPRLGFLPGASSPFKRARASARYARSLPRQSDLRLKNLLGKPSQHHHPRRCVSHGLERAFPRSGRQKAGRGKPLRPFPTITVLMCVSLNLFLSLPAACYIYRAQLLKCAVACSVAALGRSRCIARHELRIHDLKIWRVL